MCRLRPFEVAAATGYDHYTSVELTVVVYRNRFLGLNAAATGLASEQTIAYPNAQFGKTGENTITLSWTGTKPAIRGGSWILDVTNSSLSPNAPHSFFYQVINVTELSATQLSLEVQPPLRDINPRDDKGTVVVLEDVVQVFERGVIAD
jgi:hypothetical protein